MGWGDELIATGQARLMQESDPRPVAVRGRDGGPRWHPCWDGNPRISSDGAGAQWLESRPGHRPYIAASTPERWTWREWECPRGEIYLTKQEAQFGRQYAGRVVIEPNLLAKASPNKDWGFERYFDVVRSRPHVPWLQIGPPGTRWLPGVTHANTTSFRQAAAILANARAYVGPEGGLHHAAAAVGVPAVVIFGGYISPAQTGYRGHVNIFTGGEPCGMRVRCEHCQKAMSAITPKMVIEALANIGIRA